MTATLAAVRLIRRATADEYDAAVALDAAIDARIDARIERNVNALTYHLVPGLAVAVALAKAESERPQRPVVRYDQHAALVIHGWQRDADAIYGGIEIIDAGDLVETIPARLTGEGPLCLSAAAPGPCQCGALTLQTIVPRP